MYESKNSVFYPCQSGLRLAMILSLAKRSVENETMQRTTRGWRDKRNTA